MKQRIIRADRIIMPAANVCDECLTAVYAEAPIAGMTADDMALCARTIKRTAPGWLTTCYGIVRNGAASANQSARPWIQNRIAIIYHCAVPNMTHG